MELDEGKKLAIKLCKDRKIPFDVIAGKVQARAVTKVRREIVLALYAADLREWQIAKLLGRQQSTIWAYRNLDQKKASSNAYRAKKKRDHPRSGRDAVKRQSPKGLRPGESLGRVSQTTGVGRTKS